MLRVFELHLVCNVEPVCVEYSHAVLLKHKYNK